MRLGVIVAFLLVGCVATPIQASHTVVEKTMDACLLANATKPGDTWRVWLRKKTWFECCIDSCDVACLPDDATCLDTCQHKCWDGPPHR